jgi:hypothetical protein
MIAAPAALPLGRFGARIAVPNRDEIAREISRLSALLSRLDREGNQELRAEARKARAGLGHSRLRGDRTLTPQAVDELLERFGSGETIEAIAAAMGLSRGAVSGRLHRLRRESAGWSEAEMARFRDLVADDIPLSEVARLMGVSEPSAAAAFAILRRDMGAQAI